MTVEAKDNCSLVKKSELFAGLPSSVYESIVSSARPREFMARDAMYFAGDPIKQIFLLTEGRVKITQLSESGTEVILRLSVPGELVSELALVPGGSHSSTAHALQPCKVLAWDSANFEAAIERFPGFRSNAKGILERRLEEFERRYCEVSTETVAPRLAHSLVRLLDQIGHKVNGHVELNVSQEALAQMTAMTAFTVCRLLTSWEDQGFVKLRRETIEIHNAPRLLSLCKPK
jgi:CRP-like cAMP-binding protein